MVNLVRHLTILLLFDIPLLYYYINLGSSIILSYFWRYRNFFRCFFIMFIFNCFWIILQWTSWNFLNSISNFITNQITSCFCCFWNYSYWSSLNCICCRLHSMIKKFWAVLPLGFLPIVLTIFLPTFLAKSIAFYKYLIFMANWIAHYFLYFTL